MSAFTVMNRRWTTMKSASLHENLQRAPWRWREYHKYYRALRESWLEVPALVIAAKIKRPEWIIGDFGCGEALLADCLTNKVYSYDHIAFDDRVTVCDMSSVPVADETFDAVVISLALLGSNWSDYVKEAYRTLKHHGTLFIAEPEQKWNTNESRRSLVSAMESLGFAVFPETLRCGFYYFEAIKIG
jgi:SAM-dependent methyltransferase